MTSKTETSFKALFPSPDSSEDPFLPLFGEKDCNVPKLREQEIAPSKNFQKKSHSPHKKENGSFLKI